jgi:hypothetical protein
MRARTLFLASVLSFAPGVAWAEKAEFAAPPTAKTEGQSVRIDFAVTSATDVEVAILDAKQAVVRHLAAGVLGAKEAAPPLQPESLQQSLLWDRKDDGGQPVTGAFTVRVRLGTQAALAKVIDQPGRVFDTIYGLATDDGGNLYVASGSIYSNSPVFSIRVFDRAGKYVRTILPFPANLTVDQVQGFGAATELDGHVTPGNYDPRAPLVYDGGIVTFVGNRVRGGALWLLNTNGRLCRIGTDGACLAWSKAPQTVRPAGGPMCWAIAPDGKSLYLAGIWSLLRNGQPGALRDGVLYRVSPETGKTEPFVATDAPFNSPWVTNENGWYHFKNWGRKNGLAALHGLAVDEQGRVYVCDRVNQRVAVYDQEGKLAGATAVEFADLISLAPDGTVYVSTRKIIDGYRAVNEFRVLKLSGARDGKVLAEIKVDGDNAPSMAVDTSAKPAVIWLSNVRGGGVARIEDRGSELVLTGRLNEGVKPLPDIVKVWADPETDDVYINNGWSGLARINGETGRAETLPITAIDLAIGPDRNLYLFGRKGWSEPIYRCDLAFKPVPFSGTEKAETGPPPPGGQKSVYGRYGTGWSNKGLCVGADGRIYVRHMYDWAKYYVTIFGPDGLAQPQGRIAGGILGPVDADAGGILVDRQGNLYAGMHGHPKGMPKARENEGCIVKFAPSGGGRVPRAKDAEPKAPFADWGDSVVEGALRVYPNLAPMPYGGCVCKEARFDLDGFGRLYVPNVLDFSVTVVDNAGNQIVRFGHYGNADSRGAESAVPQPAVPLGWPMTVGVNRQGRVYIGDVLNQRLIRVDLSHSAEETCAVP